MSRPIAPGRCTNIFSKDVKIRQKRGNRCSIRRLVELEGDYASGCATMVLFRTTTCLYRTLARR